MICPSDAYSTGWSMLIQIISYKEQKSNARNPRYVALELTPQGQSNSKNEARV